MKIKIKNVKITSEDEFGEIYEFRNYGVLKQGYEIELISSSKIDLRNYIGKSIDCLILAYDLGIFKIETELKVDLITERIYGEFLGKYEIPEKWKFKDIASYCAIKTIDGIILLYRSETEGEITNFFLKTLNRPLKIGDIFSSDPGKFKLLSFIPFDD